MKYRITMWNPDAEETSKVVVEREASNTNNLITTRDFVCAIWAYVTKQPFQTSHQVWQAKDTMLDERHMHLPIKLEKVGGKVEMMPNNDDYTQYLLKGSNSMSPTLKSKRIFYHEKKPRPSKKGKPRLTGRPRHFTDEEFIGWYSKAEDMAHLKQLSGVSLVSVYKHCHRLGLPSIGSTNITDSLEIYDIYRDRRSVADVASEVDLTIPTIRNHLLRAVAFKWLRLGSELIPRNPTPKQKAILDRHKVQPDLPRPKKIQHIKIVHALLEDPTLAKKPLRLHKHTGVALFKINQYLTEKELYEKQ